MYALLLFALIAGLCGRRGGGIFSPSPPAPPSLPPPPDYGGGEVDPDITDLLEPQSGTSPPAWPQVVPRGLPRFPGPGWEFDNPPSPRVVARAKALVNPLWAKGDGWWRIERTGGRWTAYRAEIVSSGKKGVVVYRVKRGGAARRPATPPAIDRELMSTNPTGPAMPVLRRGAGQPPAAPMHQVRLVQQQLGVTPANGRFGPLTEAAVRKYQTANGLKSDGIVGPETWNALLQRA